MNITLRSVVASHLCMEGQEFSSNTVGIPCMEQHRWAEGFGSNEVRTRSANFAGGRMLKGMEHSNQGPSRTLNGTEHSVRGIRGLNLGSELSFSITSRGQVAHTMGMHGLGLGMRGRGQNVGGSQNIGGGCKWR